MRASTTWLTDEVDGQRNALDNRVGNMKTTFNFPINDDIDLNETPVEGHCHPRHIVRKGTSWLPFSESFSRFSKFLDEIFPFQLFFRDQFSN
jgi:hypothetical protein